VVGCGDADSMLRFWLEREGEGMKHCRNMKRRQLAHLDSKGRKCDTVQRCGDVGRRRRDTGREKGAENASWTDVNFIG
jgi:hypothetical protein